MAIGTGSWDFEILAADGVTWLPFAILPEIAEDGTRKNKTFTEAIASQTSQEPLSEWLEPKVQEDWSGGVGVSYDVALGLDTFSSPGYVFPAGEAQDIVVPGLYDSPSPIIAIVEFDAKLWVGQRGDGTANTGRVLASNDKTGVGGGAFFNSLNLGIGEYLRDLFVAPNQDGQLHLWATSSDVDGEHGRLHRFLSSIPGWASTAAGEFGAWGRNRTVSVWWQDEDGVGAQRLVSLSSNRGHLSYTRPGLDPMLGASWVEGVRTGMAQPGGELVAARRHVWINGRDNLFDFDELGNSPALTGYTALHQGNGVCVAYMDGYVYRSLGQGLDRVRVDQGPILQEVPGICTPGYATRSESSWTVGWPTALQPWNGGMLCAMFSLLEGRPAIYWGRDRTYAGVETANPLVWHGPFAFAADEPATVTRMGLAETEVASQTRLWVATWTTSQNASPKLAWISLPTTGSAFANLRGFGAHRYHDGQGGSGIWQRYGRLELLPDTVGDKGSEKFIYQQTIGSLNLSLQAPVTRFATYTRANPAPTSTVWGDGINIVTSPTQTYVPNQTRGNKLQVRIDFFQAAGGADPPIPAVLDSLRTTYFRAAPDVDTISVDVEYGPGVLGVANPDWGSGGLSVDAQTDALLALCRGDRTTLRDRNDARWTVKLKHALPRVSTLTDTEYGKRLAARLVIAKLARL